MKVNYFFTKSIQIFYYFDILSRFCERFVNLLCIYGVLAAIAVLPAQCVGVPAFGKICYTKSALLVVASGFPILLLWCKRTTGGGRHYWLRWNPD